MDQSFKEDLWKQFGATIDMFENSINACPDELWDTDKKFWYNAYHTLFFLDYYLSDDPEKFSPPSPYTLSEFNPDGEMPERTYTKDELLKYLAHCRNKCHDLIAGLNDENFNRRFISQYKNYSLLEMLIYNLRHVQHHVGQLNMLLRQGADIGSGWVSQTKISL
ncbi:MAG: DinB family protein [Ignavibacteria bacterium]